MQIKYIPEEFERPYYQSLFRAADVQGHGRIGGAEAVGFFTKSNLSLETLKHIWTVSDQPPTNFLDLPKFAVAVRLIQCMQNGQRGQGPNLATPPGVAMKPAMFEGVSGVTVPLPPDAHPTGSPGRPPSQGTATPTPQQAMGGSPPTLNTMNRQSMVQPVAMYPQQGSGGGGPPTPGQGVRPPMDPRASIMQQQQHAPPMRPPAVDPRTSMAMQGQHEQQQQHAPPMHSPAGDPRMSMAMQGQHAQQSSMALTAQDPYGMNTQDLARYEPIFKDQARPDGFVHGPEAVALFSKSGLSHQVLGAIWNMVDSPVDNRLDKVEFGMAMHLIVCVSIKNMPLPHSLPVSLALFKQQQSPPAARPQTPAAPPQTPAAPRSLTPIQPPHQQQQQQPHPPTTAHVSTAREKANAAAAAVLSVAAQPPPLGAARGGMSVDDAFADLSPEPMPYLETAPLEPKSVPEPAPAPVPVVALTPPPQVSAPVPPSVPPPAPTAAVAAAASTAGVAAAAPNQTHYPQQVGAAQTHQSAMAAAHPGVGSGDGSAELNQMRALLQKLQAENISLKAQMSNGAEDEAGVQKELATTIAEVARLSSALSQMRQEVATQKARFLELTAALKSAKENVGLLNQLVEEETSARQSYAQANQLLAAAAAAETNRAPMEAPVDMMAGSFGLPPRASPTPAYGQQPPQGPPPSSYQQQPPPIAAASAPRSSRPPPVVESAEESEAFSVQEPTSTEFQSSDNMSAANGLPPPQAGYPMPAPGTGYYGGPQHNRNISTASAFGFNDGDFMGGNSLPAIPQTVYPADSTSPTSGGGPSHDAQAPGLDYEEMRKRAKEADDIAREAEENCRVLLSQVAELRKVAEEADEKHTMQRRASETNPDKKKKGGLFGGSKKADKKEAKMAEQLAMEAKSKKDALLQAQGQANDAQALAVETRREADRLRKELEDAEINQASVNSLQQQPNGSYGQEYDVNTDTQAGGCGYDIPSPSESPYANPFGS